MTVEVFGMKYELAQRLIRSSWVFFFPLSPVSDLRSFLYICAPGFSAAKSQTLWEMWWE